MAWSLIKNLAIPQGVGSLVVQNKGIPIKAYAVRYKIMDDSAGLPGTKLYPSAPTDWIDMTSCSWAEIGIYNMENGSGTAYTPSTEIDRGRIVWQYKRTSTSPWVEVHQPIEVLGADAGISHDQVYSLLVDHRPSLPVGIVDREIRTMAVRWRDLIDRVARQRFRLVLDSKHPIGYDLAKSFLDEPLFSCLAPSVGEDVSVEDFVDAISGIASGYAEGLVDMIRVYGAVGEDRRNPRVEIIGGASAQALYDWSSVFVFDVVSSLVGMYGFVEVATQSCPEEIANASKVGVIKTFGYEVAGTGTSGGGGASPIKREETDGHSIEYAVSGATVSSTMLALLKDEAIRDALLLYRAPISLGGTYGGL
jgi:hypothetical protein